MDIMFGVVFPLMYTWAHIFVITPPVCTFCPTIFFSEINIFSWQTFCCHGRRCSSKFCPMTVGTDVEPKAMVMSLFHLLLVCILLLCPRGDHCVQTPLGECEGFLLEVRLNWKMQALWAYLPICRFVSAICLNMHDSCFIQERNICNA